MTSGEPRLRRLPIEPWRPAHRLQLHDAACLDRFVDAAMQVLERTGVRVLSDRAVAVFSEHGALYDAGRRVVRLSEEVVRGALSSAPRTFTLGSRDSSCDIDLSSGATYMTADGCGTEVIDWRTGERRASTKADLADATRMLDYVSLDRLLVADGQRRRLWKDRPAARARRRLEQHCQASPGHGAGRARGALCRRDGDRDRGRRLGSSAAGRR